MLIFKTVRSAHLTGRTSIPTKWPAWLTCKPSHKTNGLGKSIVGCVFSMYRRPCYKANIFRLKQLLPALHRLSSYNQGPSHEPLPFCRYINAKLTYPATNPTHHLQGRYRYQHPRLEHTPKWETVFTYFRY